MFTTTASSSYDWRLPQLDNPTRVDFLVQTPNNMGVWIALNAHPQETDVMYEIGKPSLNHYMKTNVT